MNYNTKTSDAAKAAGAYEEERRSRCPHCGKRIYWQFDLVDGRWVGMTYGDKPHVCQATAPTPLDDFEVLA